MLKRIIILAIVTLALAISLSAQDTYVVQQFGNSLSNWATSRNTFSALESLEGLCSNNPAIRVGDNIMASLAYQNGLSRSRDYTWDNYITCLQKEVDKGINITLSNIEQVPDNLIPSNYKDRKDLRFVSCKFQIGGASNFSENDLFVLINGKIAKIQEYQVTIDKKGRRQLHVDLSDLGLDEETEGWGISYNYGKSFPVGASAAYTRWKFMIGVDFGVNFDKDNYITQKVDFTNIVDYKITKGEYDLKYFITATPAFYLKYFAVGWGFGYASFDGSESITESKLEVTPDGTVIQTSGTHVSSISGGAKYKFMMRPTIKGYIPCSDNFFISLSVNYDWIMGYKEKSGISFGAGVQFLID